MNRPALTLSLQERVSKWMYRCFPPAVCQDVQERGDRFLEEALELLQANGYDRSRIPALVEYTYSRPAGDRGQETGGVMITLAAYSMATGVDMHAEGETEMERISQHNVMETIRQKQATKRDIHGPLP